MTINVQVQYRDRSGKNGVATVKVDYSEYDDVYYATNLALWGCGKNSRTIEGAVRLLVQDMATIVAITKPD